jgi:hypothetical protein
MSYHSNQLQRDLAQRQQERAALVAALAQAERELAHLGDLVAERRAARDRLGAEVAAVNDAYLAGRVGRDTVRGAVERYHAALEPLLEAEGHYGAATGRADRLRRALGVLDATLEQLEAAWGELEAQEAAAVPTGGRPRWRVPLGRLMNWEGERP